MLFWPSLNSQWKVEYSGYVGWWDDKIVFMKLLVQSDRTGLYAHGVSGMYT